MGWRAGSSGSYIPGTSISFTNSTVQVGSGSGEVSIVSTPSISNVVGLQNALNTKANAAAPIEVYINSGAWTHTRALKFINCDVQALSGTPNFIQITPDFPTINEVQSGALTIALAGKADTADLYAEVWNGSGWGRLPKLYFSNADPPGFVTGTNTSAPGYGGFDIRVKPLISDVTNLQSSLDARALNSFDSTMNATAYTSKTGVWAEDSTSTSWGQDLRFGMSGGYVFPSTGAGIGPNQSTAHTIRYTFPTGYVGGSCYIAFMAHSNAGYVDIYATRTADSAAIFVTRLQTYQAVDNSAGANHIGGIRVDRVMSGLQSFDQMEIRCRKGVLYLIGLAFSKETDRPSAPLALVHSDNVIGNPSSLSDTRIKFNQQDADQTALCNVFDALQPKVYDRQDSEEQTPEHRLGLIANEVKSAFEQELPQVTNVVGSKPVGDKELLTLDYARLCCPLIAKIKQLETRLRTIELAIENA